MKRLTLSCFLTACLIGLSGVLFPTACSRKPQAAWPAATAGGAPVFPDYTADDIVIPVNIAPLNFIVSDIRLPQAATVRLQAFGAGTPEGGAPADALDVKLRKKDGFLQCVFPLEEWHRCLQKAAGGHVSLGFYDRQGRPVGYSDTLLPEAADSAFSIRWQVSAYPIDPYLIYRLSAYDENPCKYLEAEERCTENFDKRLLMDNRLTDGQCFNCHASAQNDAACMSIHLRGGSGGTLLFADGAFRKINLPDGFPGLRLAYPAWHPSQRYIAFSSARIQVFPHTNVYKTQDLIADTLGRLLVYDLERNRLLPAPGDETAAAEHNARYEISFPVWAPDGQRVYFCRADKIRFDDTLSLVENLRRFRYHIAAMDFDTAARTFSAPYTVCADSTGSLSLPAIDPSGRYLVATRLPMGSFPSQNGGELVLMDLSRRDSATGGLCPLADIPALSSPDGDKSHQFSSNGRWMVFGSKRINGSVAAIYISHFDRNGRFHAPFVLPQATGDFYTKQLRTFLFPVLNREAAPFTLAEWAEAARGHAEPIDMRHFAADYERDGRQANAGH
ncbi:MAG: hypothetical protein K2O01_03940 [Bacteroidales bacterium]|nr:hypothetical protein [Bacteroidales bacterium]